jgi:hypothetical protein
VDTKSDVKVRELDNVCFSWQQWTETSVRFDDVGISAFHSCVVVVDLWQLFLSAIYYSLSVFWCTVTRILERTLNFFLYLPRVKRNQRDVSASLLG